MYLNVFVVDKGIFSYKIPNDDVEELDSYCNSFIKNEVIRGQNVAGWNVSATATGNITNNSWEKLTLAG